MDIENLKEILSSVCDVPTEINECLKLIEELDRKSSFLKEDITEEFKSFNENTRSENRKKYIRHLIQKAKRYSEKKIELLAKMSGFIDNSVHNLDRQIKDLDDGPREVLKKPTGEVLKELPVDTNSKIVKSSKRENLKKKHESMLLPTDPNNNFNGLDSSKNLNQASERGNEELKASEQEEKLSKKCPDKSKDYKNPQATKQMKNKYRCREAKEKFVHGVDSVPREQECEDTSGCKKPRRPRKGESKPKPVTPEPTVHMHNKLSSVVAKGEESIENSTKSVERSGSGSLKDFKIPKSKKGSGFEKTIRSIVLPPPSRFEGGNSDVTPARDDCGRNKRGDSQRQNKKSKENSRREQNYSRNDNKRKRQDEDNYRHTKVQKTSPSRNQTQIVASPESSDQPRFCLCKGVAFGNMVGCDNNRCPIEWFHFGCVGLTSPPTGDWFCPMCK